MISLYLETDHPILGWFDAELFITALCSGFSNFCSPFLVSALLYWACVSTTHEPPPTFIDLRVESLQFSGHSIGLSRKPIFSRSEVEME